MQRPLCVCCHIRRISESSKKYCSPTCAANARRIHSTPLEGQRLRNATYRVSHRNELAEKQREYQKEHYNTIKAQKREWKRAEYHKKRDVLLERNREYKEQNREKSNKQAREYYTKNAEKIKPKQQVKARAYYWKNPEKSRASRATYRKNNPEIVHENNCIRRARLAGAPINDFSAAQWKELKDIFNHCCAYCEAPTEKLTQDHITPLALGGSHTLHNIVPACRTCNTQKALRNVCKPIQPVLITVAKPKRKRR